MSLVILEAANHAKVMSVALVAVNYTTSRTALSSKTDVPVMSAAIANDELMRLGQTNAGSACLTPP